MVRFISLSTGSCGNCYYLGTERYGILLDAGVGYRYLKTTLDAHDAWLDRAPIFGIFITHNHADHIKSATVFSKRLYCPVFATKQVHEGMDRNYGLADKVPLSNRRNLERDVEYHLPNTDFYLTPFSVPHDSIDNVGYYIECREPGRTTRICLVTDAGRVTPDIEKFVAMADHIIIESNHDVPMLVNGHYPERLKQRVLGEFGHMSNDTCAELLKRTWHPTVRHIFLCHISGDNNTPELAYAATEKALTSLGLRVSEQKDEPHDILLKVLERMKPSDAYPLDQGTERKPAQQLEIVFD